MPIYFTLSIYRALLSGGVRAEHSKPYSKRDALLYCVALPDSASSRLETAFGEKWVPLRNGETLARPSAKPVLAERPVLGRKRAREK
jgi:hypothetical protein